MSRKVMAGQRSAILCEGFTLLEVLLATALLGFALLGLFSLHNVAIRNNRHAARMTTCSVLAQEHMEYLMGLPLSTGTTPPTELTVTGIDTNTEPYGFLALPNSYLKPSPINAVGTTLASDGALRYYRTWNVSQVYGTPTHVYQIQVRVIFYDEMNGQPHGVTISSFRYADEVMGGTGGEGSGAGSG